MSSTTVPAVSPSDGEPSSAPQRPTTRTRDWVRAVLIANLVGQVVLVVTGGAVRLTGSGLGCSTWPECEPGQFTPVMHEAVSWHPYVEFGNRTLAALLVAVSLLTAWAVWRLRERATSFRLLGLVPLVGVVAQAVVGGLTVLVALHPAVVGSHFLLSMVLVAASTLLLVRYGEGDGAPRPLVSGRVTSLSRVLALLTVVVLGLGVVVTGSGPHSGDDEVAYRFALDPVLFSRIHAAAVWLFLAGVVALLVLLHRRPAPAEARRAAQVLLGVTLLQGLIGYVQYFTGLPEVLVGAHMLGASLLVLAQVRQLTSLRSRPVAHV